MATVMRNNPPTPFLTPTPGTTITLVGPASQDKTVSALALIGNGSHLALGGDEGDSVYLLRRTAPNRFEPEPALGNGALTLPRKRTEGRAEIDIEGMTAVGDTLFILGSHSAKRTKVDPEKTQADNRLRIAKKPKDDPDRNHLIRVPFKINSRFEWKAEAPIRSDSLRPLLKDDAILERFLEIPSKENGLDLEGITHKNNHLYIGCRGPVLRGNLAVVLRISLKAADKPTWPQTLEHRYVPLNGNGIRDLVYLPAWDAFLILSGPVGDAPLPCELHLWTGADAVPGVDAPQNAVVTLGAFPHTPGVNPEGLEVAQITPDRLDLILVNDGAPGGQPTTYTIVRPNFQAS